MLNQENLFEQGFVFHHNYVGFTFQSDFGDIFGARAPVEADGYASAKIYGGEWAKINYLYLATLFQKTRNRGDGDLQLLTYTQSYSNCHTKTGCRFIPGFFMSIWTHASKNIVTRRHENIYKDFCRVKEAGVVFEAF